MSLPGNQLFMPQTHCMSACMLCYVIFLHIFIYVYYIHNAFVRPLSRKLTWQMLWYAGRKWMSYGWAHVHVYTILNVYKYVVLCQSLAADSDAPLRRRRRRRRKPLMTWDEVYWRAPLSWDMRWEWEASDVVSVRQDKAALIPSSSASSLLPFSPFFFLLILPRSLRQILPSARWIELGYVLAGCPFVKDYPWHCWHKLVLEGLTSRLTWKAQESRSHVDVGEERFVRGVTFLQCIES